MVFLKMHVFFVIIFVCIDICLSVLWPKGVVHYTVNRKDYDLHTQDEIMSTFAQLEKEICVKFFYVPFNYTATVNNKILYISNPDKRKNCPPQNYNYSQSVIDMSIGYKCINKKDIARMAVDMLRASIEQTSTAVNSYDLIKKFQEQDSLYVSSLLTPTDRNFINAHYNAECGALSQPTPSRRLIEEVGPPPINEVYYGKIVWPLGVVMYRIDPKLRGNEDHTALTAAMQQIEQLSCVVFQEMPENQVLVAKNWLEFTADGEEVPYLGFYRGKQSINLHAMTNGAPGHEAHTLNNLMRVLGVPMMSNRPDRDNFVTVHWKRVQKGKEAYLELAPRESWLNVMYDFESVTHAPANYMCADCARAEPTVSPVQDHLWQKTLRMGHRAELSQSDKHVLSLIYTKQCRERYTPKE